MATSQYEIPQFGTENPALHGWLLEANQEGNAWLQSQRPSQQWDSCMQMMEGDTGEDLGSMVSNTQYPKPKRIARELVASLAGFRHEGEFKPLWDNSLYDKAHILTDLDRNWYITANPNAQHRAALQNAVIKGTGYLYEEWDPFFWGAHKGDIKLTSLDPSDVTFLQMPKDNDIQRAYMVIVRYELPINLAKRIYANYPGFAASLVPDQESPSWLLKGLRAVQKYISPALRVAGQTRPNSSGSYPTVNIYHGYTMDTAINEGFEDVLMGVPGSNWQYKVPFLGGEIQTNIPNPISPGQMMTRPATREDALMFPMRRYTIWSNTGVAFDGSSPWWHGAVPLARIRFNDLPWNALGQSLIGDLGTINGGIEALMRAIEDSAAARLNPPAIYDDTIVSKTWAEAFNPRMAGARGAGPINQGKIIEFPMQPGQYDVPTWIPEFIATQEGREDYLSGVRDVAAIAKAKQIPGADTLEKLLEMAGPIVQDLVRQIEEPFRQLGEWRKAYYFQFYTAGRVVQTVGPDAFDPSEWNYGPDTNEANIPDHVKRRRGELGESRFQQFAQSGAYQFDPSQLVPTGGFGNLAQQREAMKRSITDFRYEVTESGVNEIYRMTTRLFYIQMMKEGFPISWWTMAKVAKIPNFGPPPQGTNTELERWIAQQHIKIELQGELQKEMMESQGGMPGGGGGAPGDDGLPPQIQQIFQGAHHSGRGQSYARPPKMVQKDHGARSTITTAK